MQVAQESHVQYWEATGEVLGPDEVIHHVNGDFTDNRPENLVKMTRAEHMALHMTPERREAFLQMSAGLDKSGERNGRAKLTWDAVREIRWRYATRCITQAQLADEFGVTQITVSSIVRGKTWKEKKV
jgi:predicted XRE-type DNA-binding protein